MSPLTTTRHNRVCLVTINRPDRRNSLSRATLEAFGRLGASLANDRELRAVVITGAGDRAFCAGADLKERRTMTDGQVRDQLRAYRSDLSWLESGPLPTVAAVNGAALGGGLELALLCHLRVAVPSAIFALPETSLGIIPAAGGTQRLPRIVGRALATEMILLGRRLSANEALACGLIHRVVTGSDLIAETLNYIEPITQGAPVAQAAAIEAIGATDLPLKQGEAKELELYERCLNTNDRREALEAFREKRKPVFKGE